MQGYFGAAVGKGKQVAKNELEKLDLKNMTCREAVYKAAKMYFPINPQFVIDVVFT